MTYTAKIEQTKDYKKRMHSMPNTDTFEEKDCDSLSNIRNAPFPSGWIKESGTPPCSHLDVIVVTDEPCELGVKPDCMDDAVAIAESYVKSGKSEDINSALSAVVKKYPDMKADVGDSKKQGGFKVGAGSSDKEKSPTTADLITLSVSRKRSKKGKV